MPFRDASPDANYEDVFLAVMASERGRRFLSEFAARSRSADTTRIMSGLERIGADGTAEETRPLFLASDELDAILSANKSATAEILTAAEHIQSLSSELRAGGASPSQCDALEDAANSILTACAFEDIAGSLTSRVMSTLRSFGERVNATSKAARRQPSPDQRPQEAAAEAEEFLYATAVPEIDDLTPNGIESVSGAGRPMATGSIGQSEIDILFAAGNRQNPNC